MENIVFEPQLSLRKKYPSEWNSYRGAKYRCTSENASDYKYYGGRGVEFRFDSFAEFLLELGRKPSKDHTVERIDVNGHYEQGNVKWATRKEQANNMRTNHLISAFGKTLTVVEWSELTGIKQRNIHFRVRTGWCVRPQKPVRTDTTD
jgi:Fic family protein